jgi:hypothetical protein
MRASFDPDYRPTERYLQLAGPYLVEQYREISEALKRVNIEDLL